MSLPFKNKNEPRRASLLHWQRACSGFIFYDKSIRAIFIGYKQIFHSHKQARNTQKYGVQKVFIAKEDLLT